MLSLGVRAVGDRCAHPWRWVPRAFRAAEILLDVIYTLGGGGLGFPGPPLETAYDIVVYGFLMFGKDSRQVSIEAGE